MCGVALQEHRGSERASILIYTTQPARDSVFQTSDILIPNSLSVPMGSPVDVFLSELLIKVSYNGPQDVEVYVEYGSGFES